MDIERGRVDWLSRGSATKARVWTVRAPSGALVVAKDFAHLAPWIRWWGRLQVRREVRALRLLDGVGCVPRLVGRVDAHAFVTTAVPGRTIAAIAASPGGGPAVTGLAAAVRSVHRRGVVHLDLRSRDNVRVDGSGGVFLVDWASALHVPPGSLRHRVLFRALTLVDRSALVKWKGRAAPARLSPEERAFARRWRFWRVLWPVNRKGAGRIGFAARGARPAGRRAGQRT